jgi:hypothetical protein
MLTMKRNSRKSKSTAKQSSAGHESSGSLPSDVLLAWSGRTARFSRILEGGPGRIGTLLTLGMLNAMCLWQGIRLTDSGGIDGGGPLLILLAVWLGGVLIFWVLLKAFWRDPVVMFYVSERGVGVAPSAQQRRLDASLGWVMRIAFWLSWKGGQWSAWHPFTVWRQIRQIEANDANQEILVLGGPWNIRLVCNAENYDTLREMIRRRVSQLGGRGIFVRRESLGTALPAVAKR